MRDIAGAKAADPVNNDVVIIGGGAAGITVAAQLLKHSSTLTIAIVEPSESMPISRAGRLSALASSRKSRLFGARPA